MLQFFSKKKNFLFVAGLFLLALILFARSIEKKNHYTLLDRIILGAFAPPLKITTLCINKATRLWGNYVYLVNLKQRNNYLENKVEGLEIENQLLQERAGENTRLRRLLAFKEKGDYTVIAAEIIGRDPSSWFKTILIDKGRSNGITSGAGVMVPRGVVGRVMDVSDSTAKVLLLTDVNSAVDAVIKRTRDRGIVEGYTENTCKLSYILKTEDIQINDRVVSSGLQGLFPKGLSIGSVSHIRTDVSGFFQFVEVKPSVDFSKLNAVLVVLSSP